jgi:murein DD-endopeptidase MepM/ murein hydrolase activator NlpD
MLGAPGQESKPADTSLGMAPGAYDVVPATDGIGVQSTANGSDRSWMEFMLDNDAYVSTEYKGPPTANMSYQEGHGATADNHAAYDISCMSGNCSGKSVTSPVTGKVVCSGYGQGTGGALASCTYSQNTTYPGSAHTVVVEVGTTPEGQPIQLAFNHVGESNLQPGQTINVGDQLGTIGDTDGGPHIHLEGWVGDPQAGYTLVDPQLVVGGYYGPVNSVAAEAADLYFAANPNGTTPFGVGDSPATETGSATSAPQEWSPVVEQSAASEGVPPEILSALLQQESQYDPNAVSPAGAQGIAQFMPETAAGMGIDPLDPNQAIPAAARYLKQQYDTFGSWELALAAYNAGPGNVQKYGGIPPFPETQHYVETIMGAAS